MLQTDLLYGLEACMTLQNDLLYGLEACMTLQNGRLYGLEACMTLQNGRIYRLFFFCYTQRRVIGSWTQMNPSSPISLLSPLPSDNVVPYAGVKHSHGETVRQPATITTFISVDPVFCQVKKEKETQRP